MLDNNSGGLSQKERRDQDYLCINTANDLTYRGIGENNHWNFYQSIGELAGKVVQGWMDSPPHEKNILWTPYHQEGIGVSVNETTGDVMVTQNFCRTAITAYSHTRQYPCPSWTTKSGAHGNGPS